MPVQVFLGKVFMEERSRTIELAKEPWADFTLWYKGSKQDQGGIATTVVWEKNKQDSE